MELEELQKIWNEQKGENMYAINESSLHNSILKKKNLASRRMNTVEIGLMSINATTGIIILIDAMMDQEGIWDYLLGLIMLLTVIFLAFFRQKRLRKEKVFDRTMLGELDHAIANSNSIVQITTMMIYYYLIPLCTYTSIKMFVFGASLEKWLLVVGAYVVAFFIVYYERRVYHIPRKEKLINLRNKLCEN
jgi:sterol desaturase/sphingolipid hydroxylase (fatty acid hydroxylase superfamily)